VLAGGGAAALAPTDDLPLPVGQLGEQFKVFVIDVQRPGAFAIDEDRVLLLTAELRLSALAHRTGGSFRHTFVNLSNKLVREWPADDSLGAAIAAGLQAIKNTAATAGRLDGRNVGSG